MSEALAIEAEALTTLAGGRVLHRDLNLTVRRGEVLAVVGGSGSGKTVLLRTLSLLQPPAGGRLTVLGQDAARLGAGGLRALRRRIGILFQQGALFTGLSVLDNVCLPLAEYTGLSLGDRRELGMLRLGQAGLPADAAGKFPGELSGGMIKRAALARALALDPELLFLDEPSAGLDPVTAAGLDELLGDLRELLGLTVLMVTHDLDSIARVSDRVAFLGRGALLAVAPVAELAASQEPEIHAYFAASPRDFGKPTCRPA
ncbi:ABC transporter ATP-binding protein [Immundisolibacter sp.]|uniref:ABC transporter ATP-binding protein n=1 Tax=Immundisolibacter sp. TaxID=1934948 RepID=UPI001988D9E5|nr:ATP-binding cassette domain-containing protein [Immundisolibacter sp.]MBC7162469.1 ATP-binding cassette domain-containing protein [Immundisolibacter sp.]MEA3219796.1 putative ribonucleotide transport ATP-binding protein mkl [Immundisolibacter sp.]